MKLTTIKKIVLFGFASCVMTQPMFSNVRETVGNSSFYSPSVGGDRGYGSRYAEPYTRNNPAPTEKAADSSTQPSDPQRTTPKIGRNTRTITTNVADAYNKPSNGLIREDQTKGKTKPKDLPPTPNVYNPNTSAPLMNTSSSGNW